MRKKKQTTPKEIDIRKANEQRGKVASTSSKPDLIAASLEKPADEVLERLAKIGKDISRGWQSEKSAVEILSETRR